MMFLRVLKFVDVAEWGSDDCCHREKKKKKKKKWLT